MTKMFPTQSLLCTTLCLALSAVASQNTVINLDQGPLVGVFPESSRTAVYTFLGIPYAEPPVGALRFRYPRAHRGWNKTLLANGVKAMCPQMSYSVYDETPDGAPIREPEVNEDCLYLNIWVPEVGLRFGSLPVLAIITGEEMSFDWSRNRPSGLDFSSEGVVVVTIQYRSNIFGWIGLDNEELPGNYGIHDQELALQWIQHNIQHFGGNPKQVTLLGHGTSGFAFALIHMISPRSNNLFTQLILMSGAAVNLNGANNLQPSQKVIEKLGCQFEALNQVVVKCLRSKSMGDLQKAFESVYVHGNYSSVMGPVVDGFRPEGEQYIPMGMLQALALGNYTKRPIIVGVCSNEGAFIHNYWIDLAKEGYGPLRAHINHTTIPLVLREIHFPSAVDKSQVLDTLNWKYFGQIGTSASYLLNAMQRMISEAKYESFFYHVTESLSRQMALNLTEGGHTPNTVNTYAYAFQIANSMDMRGKVNLFGGASHSSDLPFLLGPSLFQQIARRRFTPSEEKICRKMRTAFANFVKTGNPTPGRLYDAWLPYTQERKFIQIIGQADAEPLKSNTYTSPFEKNLAEIEALLEKKSNAGLSRPNRNEFNPYQLGDRPVTLDNRQTKSSYLTNQQDYSYFYHLKKVYSFWNILLPNMAHVNIPTSSNNITVDEVMSQRVRLLEASADAVRYKHAFFLMLALVCVLLALLGVCIYLLRRQPAGFASESL